jgi:hypothetical protein
MKNPQNTCKDYISKNQNLEVMFTLGSTAVLNMAKPVPVLYQNTLHSQKCSSD